ARVVRFGEVFHAAFTDRCQVARQWSRVQVLAEQAGRDPATIGLSLRVFADFAGSSAPERSLNGSPEQMADTIGRCREMGVGHLVLDLIAPGPEARLEALQRFAADVIPRTT